VGCFVITATVALDNDHWSSVVTWDAAHDLKLLVSAAASPWSIYRTVHHDDAYNLMFIALARSTSAAAAARSWLALTVDAHSSNMKVSSQPSEAGAQAAGWHHWKVAAEVHDSDTQQFVRPAHSSRLAAASCSKLESSWLAARIKLGAVLIKFFFNDQGSSNCSPESHAISHGFSTISRNVSQLHADAATAEIVN
jgi:hypothetical protein